MDPKHNLKRHDPLVLTFAPAPLAVCKISGNFNKYSSVQFFFSSTYFFVQFDPLNSRFCLSDLKNDNLS